MVDAQPVGRRDAAGRRARCGPTSWCPSATSGCSARSALGYLYVAEEHREGEPLEQNWIVRAGSEDFAAWSTTATSISPARGASTSASARNFELMPMAIAALEQLHTWQIPRVAATLSNLTTAIASTATEMGLDPKASDQRGPHMLGVRLPASVRSTILPALEAEHCYAPFVANRYASRRICTSLTPIPSVCAMP